MCSGHSGLPETELAMLMRRLSESPHMPGHSWEVASVGLDIPHQATCLGGVMQRLGSVRPKHPMRRLWQGLLTVPSTPGGGSVVSPTKCHFCPLCSSRAISNPREGAWVPPLSRAWEVIAEQGCGEARPQRRTDKLPENSDGKIHRLGHTRHQCS